MVNRQPATIDTSVYPSYNGATAAQHPPDCVAKAMAKIRGRATKMSPEIVESIITDLRDGVTMTKACAKAGISMSTFHLWREINREFSDLVAGTRADWTTSLVDKGLSQLEDVQAIDSTDSSKVRKAEVLARHTLEIAGRLNPQYAAKQTNTNLNVNVEIDPVDLSKFMG